MNINELPSQNDLRKRTGDDVEKINESDLQSEKSPMERGLKPANGEIDRAGREDRDHRRRRLWRADR